MEFEWSQNQANRLMVIASELSNYAHERNLPEGIRPAHTLASAMSKEDEEGKQERGRDTTYPPAV